MIRVASLKRSGYSKGCLTSKVAKAFLSLAIVFLLQTGCISRGELIREGTEVPYCTDEACVPRSNEFTEEWGPVRLDGEIGLLNPQQIAWGEEIEKQLADARAKIKEKIDAMECGPNCIKEVTGEIKFTLILGSQKQPAKKPKKIIGVFSTPLENSHSLPHYFLRDLRMYLRFCEMRILKIEAKKFETFVRE